MSLSPARWFDAAPCGLVSTTLEGMILEANETFLAWTGYTRDELIGSPFVSLLSVGSQLFYETRHRQVVHLKGAVDEVALTLVGAGSSMLPMLVNSSIDAEARVIRSALFKAIERRDYENDLLRARKSAEASEARVRILQEISSAFGVSASDEDAAASFAEVARGAFTAKHTAVLLIDDAGKLALVAGTDPLAGGIPPEISLRDTPDVVVVRERQAREDLPELAAAMRAARIASLSITPLLTDGERLGIMVCYFGRRTEFDDHFFDLQQALGRQASQTLVRVRLQRRLAYLALNDQLTGVANRQSIQQSLDEAIAHAAETMEPLAVLFLDVDRFKEINDRFGHATGDAVLVELAARLRRGVRAHDVVGRIGGDEFVAVCRQADVEAATAIAQRVLALTRAPIPVEAGVVSSSVSIGVTLYQPQIDERPTAAALLVRADGAMYDSKGAGKDRVTLR